MKILVATPNSINGFKLVTLFDGTNSVNVPFAELATKTMEKLPEDAYDAMLEHFNDNKVLKVWRGAEVEVSNDTRPKVLKVEVTKEAVESLLNL